MGIANPVIDIRTNLDEHDTLLAAYFFRSLYDLPFLEREALRLCSGTVLDIGAGAGTHSLILQDWGLEVWAIEISGGAVEVMQKRGVKNVIYQDVFDYSEQKFDTLLMLMNGIGVGGTLEGLNRFLQHAKKLLHPGGQIVFDSSDIINAFHEADGAVYIDLEQNYYGEVDYHLSYNGIESQPFKWLYVDANTLAEYAGKNGFRLEIVEWGNNNDYMGRLVLVEE